jgi:hypothetical protein
MTQFFFQDNPWLLRIVMLVVLGIAIELPYRFAGLLSREKARTDTVNAIQGGLLTLSAFVLGLSFAQASARFDSRRALVVTEATAIGTTWLRADQLEPAQSKRFRRILTDDTAARLLAYKTPNDPELYQKMIARVDRDQEQLWSIASGAVRANQTSLGPSLLMQSLNEKIALSEQQRQALSSHVPVAIIVLTLFLVALAALSLGIRFALEGSRPVLLSAVYAVSFVIVISMMIDYDRPNTGSVTVSLTPLQLQLQSMQRAR